MTKIFTLIFLKSKFFNLKKVVVTEFQKYFKKCFLKIKGNYLKSVGRDSFFGNKSVWFAPPIRSLL